MNETVTTTEAVGRLALPPMDKLLQMTWPSQSACDAWLRRRNTSREKLGCTVGMNEKEGVSLFPFSDGAEAAPKPRPVTKAPKTPLRARINTGAGKAPAAAAPAPAPAPTSTKKVESWLVKALELAQRPGGVTRAEIVALQRPKLSVWTQKFVRYAGAMGYDVTYEGKGADITYTLKRARKAA